jgi:hypothetical protein
MKTSRAIESNVSSSIDVWSVETFGLAGNWDTAKPGWIQRRLNGSAATLVILRRFAYRS